MLRASNVDRDPNLSIVHFTAPEPEPITLVCLRACAQIASLALLPQELTPDRTPHKVGTLYIPLHSSHATATCPIRRKAARRQPSLPPRPKAKVAHLLPRKASATIATTITIASNLLTSMVPSPILLQQLHTRRTGGPVNKARALLIAHTFNTATIRMGRQWARRHDLHPWAGRCCLARRRKSEHMRSQRSRHHRQLQPCPYQSSLVPGRCPM